MAVESIKNNTMTYQGSVSEQSYTKKIDISERPTERVQVDKAPIENVVVSAKEAGTATEEAFEMDQKTINSIKKAVARMNSKANTSIAEFGYHEATNRITVKIVDKETKEVIREFPPEKTLDMIAKAWEMAGLLVDEKR